MALGAACSKGPDPWSPKTYPLEVKPYLLDFGALDPAWKKYEIKGMEDSSFFYAHDSLEAVISVTFTCGKYQDVKLYQLADHLSFPMGKDVEIIQGRYLDHPDKDIYHMVARGIYLYHEETLYKELGLVPDQSADTVIDAYVIGEPHCLVDIVLATAPDAYDAARGDFQDYIRSLGVPADMDYKPGVSANCETLLFAVSEVR